MTKSGPKPRKMPAYSSHSGRTYPTWEDLVDAESNGFVVVIITDRERTAPSVFGPYLTEREAKRVRSRLYAQVKKDERPYPVHSFIRILWKELA